MGNNSDAAFAAGLEAFLTGKSSAPQSVASNNDPNDDKSRNVSNDETKDKKDNANEYHAENAKPPTIQHESLISRFARICEGVAPSSTKNNSAYDRRIERDENYTDIDTHDFNEIDQELLNSLEKFAIDYDGTLTQDQEKNIQDVTTKIVNNIKEGNIQIKDQNGILNPFRDNRLSDKEGNCINSLDDCISLLGIERSDVNNLGKAFGIDISEINIDTGTQELNKHARIDNGELSISGNGKKFHKVNLNDIKPETIKDLAEIISENPNIITDMMQGDLRSVLLNPKAREFMKSSENQNMVIDLVQNNIAMGMEVARDAGAEMNDTMIVSARMGSSLIPNAAIRYTVNRFMQATEKEFQEQQKFNQNNTKIDHKEDSKDECSTKKSNMKYSKKEFDDILEKGVDKEFNLSGIREFADGCKQKFESIKNNVENCISR